MRTKQFAWIVGITGVAAMLLRVAYIQGKLLYNITYRFAQIRPLKITASEAVIAFNMYLRNESAVGFTLRDIYVDVYTGDDIFIGSVKQKSVDSYTPPKGEGQAIPLVMTVKPNELKGKAMDAILGIARNRQIAVKYKGKISVRSGLVGVRNLPFTYTYIPDATGTD